MKIVIGCDHGGYELKKAVISALNAQNFDILDVGTNSNESVDYPDFAVLACEKIIKNEAMFGVLICTTGEGISITANKIKGIRCGIGYNDDVASLMRKHNNANVIAFGAKYTTIEEAIKRIMIFISTEFEGGRHERRVNKINSL